MSNPHLHPTESERQSLIAHVADLNENKVLALVEQWVAQGHDPLAIIEDCQEGLRQVGRGTSGRSITCLASSWAAKFSAR